VKVVYIAGPFTAPTAWQIAAHVRNAENWGLDVARCGAMPLIPHANSAGGLFYGQLTAEFWYEGTLELLKRCDAALFIPGWLQSEGSKREHTWCKEHRLRIFGSKDVPDALRAWANGESRS
jgi:Domain of unknown function (DUF4406)